MGGPLETLVSPRPLPNNALSPLLILESFPGNNGKLDIDFEVVVEMDAFDGTEEADFSILLVLKEDNFLFLSMKARGDMDFDGDDGGEYCCALFPATRIACSAAYLAAASTCSTLEGLTDFDRRSESKSFVFGDLRSFSRLSRSLLLSLYSDIDGDKCLAFLRCLLSSSELAWLDKGERDLDLDADRSLLLFLEFSFSASSSALVLVVE